MAGEMRIAHVHWAYPPTTGGVESHLADVIRLQRARGHAVTLITGEPEPIRRTGDDIVTTPLLNLDETRTLSGTSGYPDALRGFFDAVLTDRGAEIVHGHNLHHFAPEPALALDEARARLGFRLHHTFHETWPDLLHERPVYRGWDGNYAISEHIQRECAERIGFRPQVLRPGVDTDRFIASTAPSNDPPVIAHPARLLPWKGVHVTVQAVGILRDRGTEVRLLLTDTRRIADWDRELEDYRGTVLGMIRGLGLEEAVELRPVAYADMPRLYAEADVIVYPSVEAEPFGLVPVEAMAAGRPVVASRCGGIPESVRDGVTGFVVPPGDPVALADALAAIVGDADLARRMGEAGRERAVATFRLQRYLEVLERRYRAPASAAAV
jgi:glycosyltransferase involved in cell wall biosynthesis